VLDLLVVAAATLFAIAAGLTAPAEPGPSARREGRRSAATKESLPDTGQTGRRGSTAPDLIGSVTTNCGSDSSFSDRASPAGSGNAGALGSGAVRVSACRGSGRRVHRCAAPTPPAGSPADARACRRAGSPCRSCSRWPGHRMSTRMIRSDDALSWGRARSSAFGRNRDLFGCPKAHTLEQHQEPGRCMATAMCSPASAVQESRAGRRRPDSGAAHRASQLEVVNGSRILTSWRQLNVDHLLVHGSSVAAVGTRPRFRSRRSSEPRVSPPWPWTAKSTSMLSQTGGTRIIRSPSHSDRVIAEQDSLSDITGSTDARDVDVADEQETAMAHRSGSVL
jgi:hypothetical protein